MNPKLLLRALTQNSVRIMNYYTNRVTKSTLYSKISPLGNPRTSVLPELEQWVRDGNKVRFAELQRIVHDLRRRKRFSQALEVSEWMNTKGICTFSPSEFAVQLDLIGKVHGFVSAETYFNNLKEQDKTHKTYGALLNCYVRQKQTNLSLAHFQKMKEMGLASSPLTYNDIMCLYTNINQHDKVPYVLAEMKANNVSPDNFSYRICINSYGTLSDIEGMERTLNEMEIQPHVAMDWNTYAVAANFYIKAGLNKKAMSALKRSEERLENNDGTGYNHLISLYASLGNKSEVLRLWGLEKIACNRYINRDYITMLQSLVRLNAYEEAEEILKQWESSGNCYDSRVPNIVVLGYARNCSFEKAESILKDLMMKDKMTDLNSWVVVAAGYLDNGKGEKAFNCLKSAFSRRSSNKKWKPNAGLVNGVLSWLGDEGNLEDVESFIGLLRTVMPVSVEMYNALIKASLKDGKGVEKILQCMKHDKIDGDEETKILIKTNSICIG